MKDYQIHFAPAAYNPDGTFESTNAVVIHPTRTITESEGFWGGSFSNIDDADGNPRLIGGFNEAGFTEEDGSEAFFLGIFTAKRAAGHRLSGAAWFRRTPGSVGKGTRAIVEAQAQAGDTGPTVTRATVYARAVRVDWSVPTGTEVDEVHRLRSALPQARDER